MATIALKKSLVTTLLACGLFTALPSAAEFITQEDAAEADAISVDLSSGKHAITVAGCAACPLELEVDSNTRFFFNGKEINSHQISVHSGKPGTAIFRKDDKHAISIRW